MKKPRVTYIIANHNYQDYIKDAIYSAQNQDYGELSICFVDDKSDNQNEIKDCVLNLLFQGSPSEVQYKNNLAIFSGTKNRAIFILDKNYGPSYARNVAIEETINETDIYAILDADDINYGNKISICVETMLKDMNNIGVVYADYDIYNTQTGLIFPEFKEPYDFQRLTQECIVHSGSLINKKALQKVKENTGYYDETMRTCEDYDLWMRIAEEHLIVHVPEILSYVRVQPKNSSITVAKETWQKNWQRVQEKYYKRRQLTNV